jgi:hypothetical protein
MPKQLEAMRSIARFDPGCLQGFIKNIVPEVVWVLRRTVHTTEDKIFGRVKEAAFVRNFR